MRTRGRSVLALAAVAAGLALPGSASAHAYLVKTAILLLRSVFA